MPYTKRTGMSIELGGFSTAVEPTIKKIFYTEELVRSIFKRLKNVKVSGINYLVNMIIEKNEGKTLLSPITESFLKEELTSLGQVIDGGVLGSDGVGFGDLPILWNEYFSKRANKDPLTKIFEEEIRLFDGKIPAHWARHMLVTGNK